MRNLALITICLALFGCASSNDDTLPQRQYCEDRMPNLWRAAQMAVNELGFNVVNANPQGGTILGRMEADIYGSEMEINVSITENKGGQMANTSEPKWVQVKVSDANNPSPDEHRKEQMKLMENQFINMMAQLALCGGPQ